MSHVWGVSGIKVHDILANKHHRLFASSANSTQHSHPSYIFQSCNNSKVTNQNLYHCGKTQNTIIADAKIFNKKELQNKLELNNIFDLSECEIILFCYKRWGIHCLKYLVGDFVFAIWDDQLQQLFLARDHSGQRNIFYYLDDQKNLYFSNFTKIIFEISELKKEINEENIALYLSLMTNDNDSTFFQNIKKIPPAHYLILNKNQFYTRRYWSAEEASQDKITYSNCRDYYNEFLEIYRQAISERVSSFDRTACELSGGLDSSSITCITAQQARQKNKTLKAFGYRPSPGLIRQPVKNWNYDDQYYMDIVCQKYKNISLDYIYDSDKKLFEHNNALLSLIDEPPMNIYNLLWKTSILESSKRYGINTILTGEFGNFTVSWAGEPFHSTNLLKRFKRRLSSIKRSIHAWQFGETSQMPWQSYSAIHQDLALKYNLFERFQTINADHQKQIDTRIFYFDSYKLTYGSSILTTLRNMYGIEFFDPTSDIRIMEYCLKIPNTLFQNERGSRLLIRNSMQDLMPKEICERKSRGMQAADWYLKIENEKNYIQELLMTWRKSYLSNYIDIEYLIKKFKTWNCDAIANSHGYKYTLYENIFGEKLTRSLILGLFLKFHNPN